MLAHASNSESWEVKVGKSIQSQIWLYRLEASLQDMRHCEERETEEEEGWRERGRKGKRKLSFRYSFILKSHKAIE